MEQAHHNARKENLWFFCKRERVAKGRRYKLKKKSFVGQPPPGCCSGIAERLEAIAQEERDRPTCMCHHRMIVQSQDAHVIVGKCMTFTCHHKNLHALDAYTPVLAFAVLMTN